jgi:tRNA threonylcarbamoyladenosine biosynthesis protein TsaE
MSVYYAGKPEELLPVAEAVLMACSQTRVVALYGEMGAGKTTFVNYLCKVLGSVDQVQSPTFSMINEYRSGTGQPIYHFDFYRIRKPEEAFDIGYEDYFYSGAWCFIEWPGLIEQLLPEHTLKVFFEGDPLREIRF